MEEKWSTRALGGYVSKSGPAKKALALATRQRIRNAAKTSARPHPARVLLTKNVDETLAEICNSALRAMLGVLERGGRRQDGAPSKPLRGEAPTGQKSYISKESQLKM